MSETNGQDLAARLIAEHFARIDGTLHVGGLDVRALAEAHGTPLFLYDAEVMRRAYRTLSAAVSGFAGVDYSVKANPNPAVIRVFRGEEAGAEIASGAEFAAALAAGVPPDSILFAGPGKSDADIERVVAGGIGEIHLENAEEIARVAAAGRRRGRTVRVAIRANPGAAAQGARCAWAASPRPSASTRRSSTGRST